MMAVKPVFLGSDVLLWSLLLVCALLAWLARRDEPTRLAWGRFARRPIGMASATLLTLFLLVGLLDSIHFRLPLPPTPAGEVVYSVEVVSLLDQGLAPLRTRTEKTYSAPLAIRLFAKESLDGDQGRDFPRLRWGGAHLGDPPRDPGADQLRAAALGAVGGLLVCGLLAWPVRRSVRQPGHPWRAVGGVLVVVGVLGGILASLAVHYHVLGTDKVGQDVLYLSLKSIRTGLLMGTLTTLIMLPAAIGLGLLAGYVGGWVDDAIQYLYTTLNAIPDVLLIAAAVLMMQVVIDTHPQWFGTAAERADARLLALCLIMGITSWTGLARLLRGEALKLRELEYVQAARAFGVSSRRILVRHILPNVLHIVLIAVVMDFSRLVLAEAVLSYVGVGVDPTTISFGTMINAARMELAREPMVWWSLAAAFSFMFALVLAANLFADAVRDAFDPRTR